MAVSVNFKNIKNLLVGTLVMFKTPIPTNEDNRKGNNSDAIYKRS